MPEAIPFPQSAARLERRRILNDTTIRSLKPSADRARRLFRRFYAGVVAARDGKERPLVDRLLPQQERSTEAAHVGPLPGREARRCPRAGAGGAAQGCSRR